MMANGRMIDTATSMKLPVVAVTVGLLMSLAMSIGCGRAEQTPRSQPPLDGFAACPVPVTSSTPRAPSSPLPALELPCMDGSGRNFALDRPVGTPMVINLWGSWCPPCGRELPAFVRLDQATDAVIVMGVVTEDSASRAKQAASELGARFPNLFDRAGALRRALGHNALPVTLFVDADGGIRHIHSGPVFDDVTLREATSRYLNVESVRQVHAAR